MARSLVTVVVEVEHPWDWNQHDINDVLRFHLGISDLNSIEADISAVKIHDCWAVDRVQKETL